MILRGRPGLTQRIRRIVVPGKHPFERRQWTRTAPRGKMTMGMDFDRTYTADPKLMDHFIDRAQQRGHKVVITTARDDSPKWAPEVREAMGGRLPIVFGGYNRWKESAAKAEGHRIHTWLDDNPEYIKPMSSQRSEQMDRSPVMSKSRKNFPEPVTFGINYEDTMHRDPELYHDFINQVHARGHKAVIYSHLHASHPAARHIRAEAAKAGVPAVFTGPRGWADDATRRAGHPVDVWMGAHLDRARPIRPEELMAMRHGRTDTTYEDVTGRLGN